MKRLFTITILSLTAWTTTVGQDKDVEFKFYHERQKIRDTKIKEITESVSQYWKNICVKDSAEIRFTYVFNDKGDLIQIDEYHRQGLWKTTTYTRNKTGDFTSKQYIFYDSIGKVKFVDSWSFEFNRKGKKVTETWTRGQDTVRLNRLSYDKKGNYVEQFTPNLWQWKFKYDNTGKLIESFECRIEADSLNCYSVTKYSYEKGVLKNITALSTPDNKVWKEFFYSYDTNQYLTEIKELRRGIVQQGNEPKQTVISTYMTKFKNNNKGHCIVKSEFGDKDDKPFRCTYYEYKYY